jgi:hypothetical protein
MTMTSQETFADLSDAITEALSFAPEFAAAVLNDHPDQLSELARALHDAPGDPVDVLRAVAQDEDLVLTVSRVKWLAKNLPSPARWLAGKVAARA